MSPAPLELIAEREGDVVRLLSPGVGLFTRARHAGSAFAPGEEVGTLLVLGEARALHVPDAVHGLVANERPERVHEPVGHGSVLYELRPLEGAGLEAQLEAARDADTGLVLRSPQAGRFYRRPGPDQPNFVAAGDEVEVGRPVGLIEVMKTFTHVPYRAGGGLPAKARVVRLLAEDGADVAEGDPLLEVEPA